MGRWKSTDFDKTCGDCIHADICEHNPSLEFSRENIAWCDSFKDKTDVVEVVRCEKCIYEDTTSCPLCYIEKHTLQFINHDGVFYCAKGERKDGAGE